MLASAWRRKRPELNTGTMQLMSGASLVMRTFVRSPPRDVADVRHGRIEGEELGHVAEHVDLGSAVRLSLRGRGLGGERAGGGGAGRPDDLLGLQVVQQPLEVGRSSSGRDVVVQAQ